MRETKDLILKRAVLEDWKNMYYNLWCSDESAKYMMWRPIHTEEEAKIRTMKNIEFQKIDPFAYFVYEKKSEQAIGFSGMKQIADNVFEDTGIAIGPAFTRKGYGRQILMELVHQAFYEHGAKKYVASCRSQNEPSKQLQLSCGFIYSHSEARVDPRTDLPYILDFYELTL